MKIISKTILQQFFGNKFTIYTDKKIASRFLQNLQ